MKFRLLYGQHISGEREPDVVLPDGTKVPGKKIVYKAKENDIIESPIDLVERFNDPRMAQQKFERVFTEDPLDSMTVPQLRQLAEDEEIDLRGAVKKQDIMRMIRGSKTLV